MNQGYLILKFAYELFNIENMAFIDYMKDFLLPVKDIELPYYVLWGAKAM